MGKGRWDMEKEENKDEKSRSTIIGFKQHMDTAVVLVTLIGGFYLIDGKIERQSVTQSQRTDRLYEMFIELVKEGKK